MREGNKNAATHGLSRSRVYSIYGSMLARCTNPDAGNYENYGGRGINVCDRWYESFEAFFEDMGHPPSPEHTLDRIDGRGDYEPGNCRWATRVQQQNNRSNTVWITYHGKTLSVMEWAQRIGVQYMTLYLRIKRGWGVQRALTTGRRPQNSGI